MRFSRKLCDSLSKLKQNIRIPLARLRSILHFLLVQEYKRLVGGMVMICLAWRWMIVVAGMFGVGVVAAMIVLVLVVGDGTVIAK